MPSVITIGEETCIVKSFGEQLMECRENGNLIKEECRCCNCILFLCKKYGGQCNPDKCYLERLQRVRNGGVSC